MDRAPDPPQGWDFLTNAGIASGRMGRSVAVQLWVLSELGHPRRGIRTGVFAYRLRDATISGKMGV